MIALILGAIAYLAVNILLLVLLLPFVIIWLVMLASILNRAGYSGWWALTSFFPPLLILMIWIFAFARWPNTERIQIIPPDYPPPPNWR